MAKKTAKIEAQHNAIFSALTARAEFNRDNGIPTQALFFAQQAKTFNVACVEALSNVGVDVQALAVTLGNNDKTSGSAFVAKYAVEKIRKLAQALAQSSLMQCDRYTQSMLLNTVALDKLNAKGALVCLSNAIVYDEMETAQNVKRYGNCTAGTASTQRSSTREALRVLGVASVTKAKRDDVIEFTDTPVAHAVKALAVAALA